MTEQFAGIPYDQQNRTVGLTTDSQPTGLVTAQTSGRDRQAEQDQAEWLGWAEANGYDPEGRCGMAGENMRDAFLAGMQAQRDLDAIAFGQLVKDWQAAASEETSLAESGPDRYRAEHNDRAALIRTHARKLSALLGDQS